MKGAEVLLTEVKFLLGYSEMLFFK